MFGGDDFDFVPDMDLDGDHDMMDVIILDQIFDDLNKKKETYEDDETSFFDSDEDWRDNVEEGYEYDLDPEDYDTEDDYLEALEEAKVAWREKYEYDVDLDIDPEDYDTEDEYLDAFEEAKNAWKDSCEDGTEYGIDPDDYESEEEYTEALNKAKYAWRDEAEDGSDYCLDPEDFETESEYKEALQNAKFGWRAECEFEYGVDPQDYDTYEEYKEALEKEMYAWRESAEDGSEFDLDPEDFETEEEYNDALEEARASKDAWKSKYKGNDLDPRFYLTEEDYLFELEERKHSWRKYCNNRFGISPLDFETRVEYDQAIREAYQKEREEKIAERRADPNNMRLFKFCKVATDYPEKPFYYYFYGDLDVQVGDKVVVPFGHNNKETDGVVMALGECFGCAFPCRVSEIKTVLRKIKRDNNQSKVSLSCDDVAEHVCLGGWSKYKVSNIKIESDENRVCVTFIIEKTFDKYGDSAITNVDLNWRVKDKEGLIHKTGSVRYENLQIGDRRRGSLNISNFDADKEYVLEFVNS